MARVSAELRESEDRERGKEDGEGDGEVCGESRDTGIRDGSVDGLDSNKTGEGGTVSVADDGVERTGGENSIGGSPDASEATAANSTSEEVKGAGSQAEVCSDR